MTRSNRLKSSNSSIDHLAVLAISDSFSSYVSMNLPLVSSYPLSFIA